MAKLRHTMRERKAHMAGKVVAILSSDEKILYGTLDAKSAPPQFHDHHHEMAAFIANDQRSVDLMKKYPDVECWMVGD